MESLASSRSVWPGAVAGTSACGGRAVGTGAPREVAEHARDALLQQTRERGMIDPRDALIVQARRGGREGGSPRSEPHRSWGTESWRFKACTLFCDQMVRGTLCLPPSIAPSSAHEFMAFDEGFQAASRLLHGLRGGLVAPRMGAPISPDIVVFIFFKSNYTFTLAFC